MVVAKLYSFALGKILYIAYSITFCYFSLCCIQMNDFYSSIFLCNFNEFEDNFVFACNFPDKLSLFTMN